KRMFERRIVFEVRVIYETTPEQLRAIPGIVREAIEGQADARFDRSHFKSFGAYSLDFETVYYVTKPDFNLYMDVQQAINMQILEQFAAAGIEFAYPTQVEVQRVEREPPPAYLAAGGAAAERDKPADGERTRAAKTRAPDPAGAP